MIGLFSTALIISVTTVYDHGIPCSCVIYKSIGEFSVFVDYIHIFKDNLSPIQIYLIFIQGKEIK